MRFIVVVVGKVVVVESQADFYASNVTMLKILISLVSSLLFSQAQVDESEACGV